MASSVFRFRLERVRALREQREDRAKEELAACLHARMRGAAQLGAVTERLAGARAASREAATAAPRSGSQLLASQAYLERVERQRLAAELDLDRRDAEVDSRRRALQAAARERQVLERLKERRRAEHARELARAEGALTDELALTVHRRNADRTGTR